MGRTAYVPPTTMERIVIDPTPTMERTPIDPDDESMDRTLVDPGCKPGPAPRIPPGRPPPEGGGQAVHLATGLRRGRRGMSRPTRVVGDFVTAEGAKGAAVDPDDRVFSAHSATSAVPTFFRFFHVPPPFHRYAGIRPPGHGFIRG